MTITKMSNNDMHYFGTSLPELKVDDVPAKRAQYVEEQVVKDEYGRRRFHGAFTGGFSAGYWNTVGSQEGWQPKEFKSSRHEKADKLQEQRPEDFMDDEDLGEFGIAPQRLQTQYDYAAHDNKHENSRKRKLAAFHGGPIPGLPVLDQLVAPTKDKAAVRILKTMGWRVGQGVGPRQTRKQKEQTAKHNQREIYLMQQYGFQPNKKKECAAADEQHNDTDSSQDDEDDDVITFAPEDYDPYVVQGKENRFGLGYSGLSRDSVLGGDTKHFTLFQPIQLLDKTQKRKFTISGQAFGVGALEEEDEDIYAHEDMTNYDFSLDQRNKQKSKKKNEVHKQDPHVIEGFIAAQVDVQNTVPFKIDLPRVWQPRNWSERKSRFAPLDTEIAQKLLPQDIKVHKTALGRHDMTPKERAEVLGEKKIGQDTKELLEKITAKSCNFMRGGIINMKGEEETVEAKNSTEELPASNLGFKPFLQDAAKQARYEKFLTANLTDENELSKFLNDLQPVHLSEWHREMEKNEFIQARKIYKPLTGSIAQRFTSEENSVEKQKTTINNTNEVKEERPPLKVERSKSIWKPCAQLCKRFNISEPLEHMQTEGANTLCAQAKHKPKLSVFDYIELSVNSKQNFQTPVIIAKHIEQDRPLIKQTEIIPEVVKIESSAEKIEKKTTNIAKTKFVPKTELEKRVEHTKDKPAEKKQELFKAIFESDEEDEEQKKEDIKKPSDSVEVAISNEKLIDKKAETMEFLNNSLAPRGIFTALFQSKPMSTDAIKPAAAIVEEPQPKQTDSTLNKFTFMPKNMRGQDLDNMYRPALPENFGKDLQKNKQIIAKSIVSIIQENADDDDEWVEKTDLSSSADSKADSSSSSDSDSELKSSRKKKKLQAIKKKFQERKKKKKHHKLKNKKKILKKHMKKESHKSKKSTKKKMH